MTIKLSWLKPKTLSGQINLYLSSGLVIFTLVASLVLYHTVSHAIEQTLKDKTTALAEQLAVVSLDALLMRDYAIIERYAEEVVKQSQDILYLEITSHNPNSLGPQLLAQAGKTEYANELNHHWHSQQTPILFMNRHIGDIQMVYSTDVVKHTFFQIMVFGLIGLIALLALQFMIVKRLLASQFIQPLRMLLNQNTLITTDKLVGKSFTKQPPQEFQALEQQFHDQQTKIKNYIEQLEQAHNMSSAMAERLNDGQRLAAIGQMAAGLAHNLNTPLATILGYAQMLEASNDPDTQKRASIIARQARNSAEVVTSLLNASRLPKAEMTVTSLQPFLHHFCALIMPILKPKGLRSVELPKIDCIVNTDPGLLEQVLFNLFNNAVDAQASVIQLSLTTQVNQACLVIADNGHGIDDDLKATIFKAFVTTKPSNKGTGLGLYMAKTMLLTMQANIELDSSHHGRTAFKLTLPLNEKSNI